MALLSHVQSLQRTQWRARAPRLSLVAVCAVLVAVGLRSLLIDRAPAAPRPVNVGRALDSEAEAVAEGFARAFVSWDPAHPAGRVSALQRFAPAIATNERDDALPLPHAAQRVLWSAVSDDRRVAHRDQVTVVLQTTAGFTALVVSVTTTAGGRVVVTGYPAVVGPPAVASGNVDPAGDEVSDGALTATVTRALSNFLGCRRSALAADLLPGSTVVVPDAPMRLVAADEVSWRAPDREVSVVLRAAVPGGGQLRLGYSVGVVRQAGRWFVSWIGSPQNTNGRSS